MTYSPRRGKTNMSQTHATVDSWKSAKTHTITLPSGTKVGIVIPNLPLLMKTGRIPNHLVEAAVELQGKRQITAQDLEDQYEFVKTVVVLTVQEPFISEDDVDELPFEDLEMIVQFAMRERDTDAVYHHIGGLELVDSFRDVRGL